VHPVATGIDPRWKIFDRSSDNNRVIVGGD
jgi:hypothetical protein